MLQRFSPYFWYGVLAVMYIIISLSLPVDQNALHTLHISTAQYRILLVTVLVPYILIWLVAFYSYKKMDEYTDFVQGTREHPAFLNIARGIRVMAWGLAVPAIIGSLLRGIAIARPQFSPSATIISNYITLSVPLIAFTFIGNGSTRLTEIAKARMRIGVFRTFIFTFIAFASLYTFLALYARANHDNPYYLNRWWMIATIIVPYLYAWFLGLYSCYQIGNYSQKIKGLLYKRALNFLSAGVAVTIISSIAVQFINIIFADRGSITVGTILLLFYLLLLAESIGFVLIANGAQKLKRIEEI